ncbi:MAG: hypothetical protein ACTHL1_06790 [Burkholderiaceae bacterium]
MKNTLMAAALAAAFGLPPAARAAEDPALAQLREQIRAMQAQYEARIHALEQRLDAAEAARSQPAGTAQTAQTAVPASATAAPVSPAPVVAAAPPPAAPATSPNAFNPAIALILGGTYANLSQDPARWRLQGFMPGGDAVGPGRRSFNLGESELTLGANVDPQFAGQLTFSIDGDNQVSVEEAFFQTLGLSNGFTLKGGRFLSSIGYLNSQHAHAWDFTDAPLAYEAFLGGQYKAEGLQLKWLAPTDRFLEFGAEAGSGRAFPGNDRDRNGFGSTALYAHLGDDIGDSASWRAGLSWLHTGSAGRGWDDADAAGNPVADAFTGKSDVWIADAIYKWAPNGNPLDTNFKLQGEFFRRRERGTLASETSSGNYAGIQSGWYLQGVYQFRPLWRTGLRYDRLDAGSPSFGAGLDPTNFGLLAPYDPSRVTWMVDYTPSEFSRFRLQLARDRSRPGIVDNQVYLQYIMSLGAHGAHTF